MKKFLFLALASLALTSAPSFAEDYLTDSAGTKFRLIEGGRYVRGFDGGERRLQEEFPLSVQAQYFGNAESPAHACWITKPFYLAVHEVTVSQFRSFVEATGHRTSAEKGESEMVGWAPTPEDAPLYQSHDFERNADFSWKNPGFEQQDNHPVVGVSFSDAQAYCLWLSKKEGVTYRLPTEAEWEFACKAGTNSWFHFGDQPAETVHRFANIGNVELEKFRKHSVERQWLLDWDRAPADGHIFTAPVGSFQPNAFGLQDMHGNVWEWCADLWLDTYYNEYESPDRNSPRKTAVDPVNQSQRQTDSNELRVIRGGSWYNGPIICRSSNRTGWDAPDSACYIGFRVVREADPSLSTKAADLQKRENEALQKIAQNGGRFFAQNSLPLMLHFEGDAFQESVLAELTHISDIGDLQIKNVGDTKLTQAAFQQISLIDSLVSITIQNQFDADNCDLSSLSALPKLKRLHFQRVCPLEDANLEHLARIQSLEELEFYGTNGGVSDTGLSALKNCKQLTKLHAYETQASGLFLAALKDLPLTSLEITPNHGSESPVGDETISSLVAFTSLENLRLLSANQITEKTVEIISDLPNLRGLSLDYCAGISTGGFAPLEKTSSLFSLNLNGTKAGDEDLRALGNLPKLGRLSLGSEHISDAGAEHFAKMLPMEYLTISQSHISDEGMTAFGRIPRLRQLNLQSDQVKGSGVKALIDLPDLTDLKLLAPNLTDEVFEHLARCKSLRKLRLAEPRHQPPAALTDTGLMKLQRAQWMTEIWLPRNDTLMTEAKMNELNNAMPKTGVIIYTVNWEK